MKLGKTSITQIWMVCVLFDLILKHSFLKTKCAFGRVLFDLISFLKTNVLIARTHSDTLNKLHIIEK